MLAGARPGRAQISQIRTDIDNGTITPDAAQTGIDQVVANRQAALTAARDLSVTQTDAAGPIKNLLVESFQRSLDYDRDLQDGAAAYQSGDFERYIAKVFDDALRSNDAATQAKRAFLGAYNKLRASRGRPRRRRRLLIMRRHATIAVTLLAVAVAGGCGSDAPPATQSAAPATTATATPQVSEAERNAKRDLEAAEGNATGGTGSTSTPATTKPRPAASAPTATRPPIVQRPIPFGAKRRDEMRAYARRHYDLDSFRLQGPKVIVEHFTVGDTFRSAYDTFARDVPDVELHELPAVCAHFVVDKDGTIYQLVALNNMCRHTVGLDDTAIGIEQVGRGAGEILDRPAQMRRRRAADRMAALPLRHRAAQRHRPQREPVEPLPPRERRRPAPPDPRRLDARGDGARARPDRRAIAARAGSVVPGRWVGGAARTAASREGSARRSRRGRLVRRLSDEKCPLCRQE